MISLKVEKREATGKKLKNLREEGILPAILYGPEIENINIQLDVKTFNQVHKEAGESTLISLVLEDKEYPVLIQDVRYNPVTEDVIHVDFYQPILTEEVEATVALVFEGEAPAVKDLGGTLVKEIQEIDVKALPQDLPHEITVDVSNLKTFDDEILVKDLKVADNVNLLREPEEVIALVVPAEDVESELEKPIEEEEEVEVEGEKEEVEETEEETKPTESGETKEE